MARSLEEIKTRCKNIISNLEIINIVVKSSSPTAAYDMIINKLNNVKLARAGRWLAILRRDYFDEYQKIISNQVTLQQQDNGGNKENEKNIYRRFKKIIRRNKSIFAWLGKRKKKS